MHERRRQSIRRTTERIRADLARGEGGRLGGGRGGERRDSGSEGGRIYKGSSSPNSMLRSLTNPTYNHSKIPKPKTPIPLPSEKDLNRVFGHGENNRYVNTTLVNEKIDGVVKIEKGSGGSGAGDNIKNERVSGAVGGVGVNIKREG